MGKQWTLDFVGEPADLCRHRRAMAEKKGKSGDETVSGTERLDSLNDRRLHHCCFVPAEISYLVLEEFFLGRFEVIVDQS